ncbi:MAG TPA: M48 family metalloprotease [Pyrinomonadaceae bacterium]|nr:M48 family metalloprotease [Pyrinomonadaceae bacterium]
MINRALQVAVLMLALLFTLPPPLVAMGQAVPANTAQEKPKTESSEEKKLREQDEKRKKKEEQRKNQETKLRASQEKKYRTLTEFAQDLYAGDVDFKEQVDDAYLDLQSEHANEAYRINISQTKEVLLTENQGEALKIRRLYDNPRVQEYLNMLGQRIVPDDSDKLYSFKVFVDPIPQAYTLSTGTVLVSSGMISLLENEAQLTYVLAHELAHVYKDHWRIKVMLPFAEAEYNERQKRKQMMWAGLLTLAGAGIGAAINGQDGALIGGGSGLVAGLMVGRYYSKRMALDWNAAQENEADDFALKAILDKSYDIKEVPRLYATMAQVANKDSRAQLGFLGARSRIKDRTDYAQRLIDGPMRERYQAALQANKIKGTSSEFNLIMSELKRDNGIEAFYRDMFQLAKANLQEAVMLRSDDPLAAYYYGRVMKLVGRTKEELDLAQQSLLKAVALDVRHEIPDVQLHRALLLMDTKDANNNAEAIKALKAYIMDYERKHATTIINTGVLPPNIDVLYGYMSLLGEKTWTAPAVAELLQTDSATPNNTVAPAQPLMPRIQPASETLSPKPVKKGRKQ